MYRLSQSPVGSQRSKRIKAKDVVQIALLLGVCLWLLYQVLQPHENNNSELENSEANEVLKLGRKMIRDRFEETEESGNKEEMSWGEEDNNKVEGMMDGENEEIEPEISDADADAEAENEETGEEETSGDVKGMEASEVEEINKAEEETDQEGDNTSVSEARENNYRADDASSAVAHDSKTRAAENETEHSEGNELLEEGKNHDWETIKDLEEEAGELTGVNIATNVSELGDVLENSDENSSTENDDVSLKNVPEDKDEAAVVHSEDESNSTVSAENTIAPGLNSTNSNETVSEDMPETEASYADSLIKDDSASETGDEDVESERLDTSDATNDAVEESQTKELEDTPNESLDDTHEEIPSKEADIEGTAAE